MKKHPSSPPPEPVLLSFEGGQRTEIQPGESILDAAWRFGLPVDAPCGGQGWCGRCRAKVSPSPPAVPEDSTIFSSAELRDGWRLACRCHPTAAASVTLPEPAQATLSEGRILKDISPPVAERAPKGARLGIALDLGSTTLSAQIWDLDRRRLLGTRSAANPQASSGSDIISRIAAAAHPSGLSRLSRSLRTGIADLLADLVLAGGTTCAHVTDIVAAGNTTMQHFLAGADPSPLANAPFRPAFLALPPRPAPELGLLRFTAAEIRLVPSFSAFVGGDAVAGLLSLLPQRPPVPSLLIDIGTNAELVLIRRRSFLATSAAAGPALEGGNISSGMTARPGAIEKFDFTGDLAPAVIGGGPPRGICGSGLFDLVALLLKFGLLLPDGRLLAPGEVSRHPWPKLAARLGAGKDGTSFSYSRGLSLTQDDLRQVQLAKSAVATAWQLLLKESRLRKEQIQHLYLAGSFGYSLRPGSLSAIGVIPREWEEKTVFSGNTSLSGAAVSLLRPDLSAETDRILRTTKTRHLAESSHFRDLFLGNLAFPDHGH
jgi:uncharacterized 2Fe-2S/4Fe-4S cluster protein (DUF4445 family)